MTLMQERLSTRFKAEEERVSNLSRAFSSLQTKFARRSFGDSVGSFMEARSNPKHMGEPQVSSPSTIKDRFLSFVSEQLRLHGITTTAAATEPKTLSSLFEQLRSIHGGQLRGFSFFSGRGSGGRGSRGFNFASSGSNGLQSQNFFIWVVLGLNGLVFLAWHNLTSWEDQRTLRRNFVLTEESLLQRPWTLITSAFSHYQPGHLLVNCLVFYYTAQMPLSLLGPQRMAVLLAAAAAAGGLVGIYLPKVMHGERQGLQGLQGFSSCTSATFATVALLAPRTEVLLFFIIPMPILPLLGLFTAYDVYSLLFQPYDGINHASHLGGVAVGALAALYLRRFGFR